MTNCLLQTPSSVTSSPKKSPIWKSRAGAAPNAASSTKVKRSLSVSPTRYVNMLTVVVFFKKSQTLFTWLPNIDQFSIFSTVENL